MFFLAPLVTSQYFQYSTGLKMLGYNLSHTQFIGYFEADVIASIEYPGKIPMFAYLSCFSKEVWILIIASLVVLSLVSSIDRKSFHLSSNIFEICYNFKILLISKSIQKSIINRISTIILSIWIISALVLSNQLTAYFTDFMVTAVPMIRIDSFEDLVKHKDTKIICREDDSFTVSVKLNDTQLKRSLLPMLEPYEHQLEYRKLAKVLKNLSYVYVTKRDLMVFIMMDFKIFYYKGPPRLEDILHLSEKTNLLEPYFMFVNNDSPVWLKVNLNRM